MRSCWNLPRWPSTSWLGVVVLCLLGATCVHALIHEIRVEDEDRSPLRLETFGFFSGGQVNITISGSNEPPGIKFVLRRTETDYGGLGEENLSCEFLPYPTATETGDNTYGMKITEEGFYSLLMYKCDNKPVSFTLRLEMYNPGPNYLSAGLAPLPKLFTLLFVAHVVLLGVWVYVFMRGEGKKIYRIHHLMTFLLVLKVLSLLFKAIEYHYKQTTGDAGGWAVPYYLFTGLKGITTFVVIALIGTGWAFIKPYLSEKDKKIFLVVIPLQILSNVAMVILEETAPGSQGWFAWQDILRLVDIICCGAILVPIIWSIKHLKEAAQISGKAKRNMQKLQLFRQFYLLVVSYIYFTRIIVYLLDTTLPFHLVWLGTFFTEIATLLFWCITYYKFRPIPDNPWLDLSDDEAEEPHEDDDDIEEDGNSFPMREMGSSPSFSSSSSASSGHAVSLKEDSL
ncbi:G protein-coupled receptor 107 [Balamuthia mandrillaris]